MTLIGKPADNKFCKRLVFESLSYPCNLFIKPDAKHLNQAKTIHYISRNIHMNMWEFLQETGQDFVALW